MVDNHKTQPNQNQTTNRTLITEEMYYGLIFPRTKQYKAIHDELTIYYLSPE